MATVKYSGPVASFHCPTEATIRSLKVHFSPKQLGEGTPSPENVREIEGWDGVEVSQHGKNLYSKDNVIPHTADDEWNCIMGGVKQKIAVNSWPRWTFIAPATPNATYYWTASCYDVGFLDKNKNVLTYKSAWSNTSIKAPANAAYVYHTWIKNESLNQEQLDAAFKTYDLYCDILPTIFEEQNSKKTNYEFGILGKNKFDQSTASIKKYIGSDGIIRSSDDWCCSDYIKVVPLQTYTISGANAPGGTGCHAFYDENKDFLSSVTGYDHMTFTVPDGAQYFRFSVRTETPTEVQLELGSTATAYEPYDPNHTVYGGWVDLVSGEVCEEWKSITLESLNWSGSGNRARASNSIDLETPSYTIAPDFIAEKYYAAPYSTNLTNYPSAIALGGGGFIAYYDGETLPSGKMVYKLPESIVYSLAPTQLQTFLGQNNVWSNADYVEVEYDLHETQNILARKQFIIANQPHVEKLAAAPLQSFETDMAAPIKECKVHFGPVQDLNGYSKPWVGGSGKNLFPYPFTETTKTENGITFTDLGNGQIKISGTNTGSTYAYFILREDISFGETYNSFSAAAPSFVNGDYTMTMNGIVSGIGAEYYSNGLVRFRITAGATVNATVGPMIYLTSNNLTTFEPYENVCPISGWAGVTANLASKNIASKGFQIIGKGTSYGGNYGGKGTFSNDARCGFIVFPVPSGSTVTVSCKNPDKYWVDRGIAMKLDSLSVENNQYIGYRNYVWYYSVEHRLTTQTIQIPDEADGLLIEFLHIDKETPMTQELIDELEFTCVIGTEDVSIYEPCQGTTIPIDWADETSTVYGGYVDLVKGEIVAEWIAFDMTQLTLTQFSAESNLSIVSAFPGIIKSRNKMYCNILTPTSNPNISGIEGIDWNNGRVNICLSASRGLDSQSKVEQWLNDLKNNGTTPLIVANMSTPVIYTIDPQTLKTLRGANNIWSNTNGNIELKYWTH